MPDQLLKAVQELTVTVGSLENALKEYPKRKEVEAKFESREEMTKQRRKKAIIWIALVFLVGLLCSYFVTVTTITTCFISEDARAGKAGFGCSLLPGYDEAQAENQKLLKDLMVLLEQPETNSQRLDRIEKKLDLPPLPE